MYRKQSYTELQNNTQFCQAVKFVIKLQIATLLKQLADSGEESVVLTANIIDGTADHLGSDKGTGFLRKRDELQAQFLSFCSSERGPISSENTYKTHKEPDHTELNQEHPGLHVASSQPHESLDYRLTSPTSTQGTSYHTLPPLQKTDYQSRCSTESVFVRRTSSSDSRSIENEYAGRVHGNESSSATGHMTAGEPMKIESAAWGDSLESEGVLTIDLSDHQRSRSRSRSSPNSSVGGGYAAMGQEGPQFASPSVSPVQYKKDLGSMKGELTHHHSMLESPSGGSGGGVVTSTFGSFYKAHLYSSVSSDSASISPSGSFLSTSKLPVLGESHHPYDQLTGSPPYTSSTSLLESQSRMVAMDNDDEPIRIKKKADTRIYNRLGYTPRKPGKGNGSEQTGISSSEFGVVKFAGLENRHISFNQLGSPVNMGYPSPAHIPRGIGNRERSQSMSAVGSLESDTTVTRARFFSSSYDETNSPLFIDDNLNVKLEPDAEGLDLSNKRPRLLSCGDGQLVAAGSEDKSQASPTFPQDEPDTSQNGIKDVYDRLVNMSSENNLITAEQSPHSVKKYGKGNFIKVSTGYQCRICCRVIRHMNNTTAHMRIHANVKPYKCQVCHQQFKHEVDRRYHVSKQHADLFSKIHFPAGGAGGGNGGMDD